MLYAKRWLPGLAVAVAVVLSLVLTESVSAQSAAGVWRGKWTSMPTAKQRRMHQGTLRVRLVPTGANTYAGRFSGRFALVIPYSYRAEVIQHGDQLYSSKRLGPMGEYRMNLGPTWSSSMQGGWSAGEAHGGVSLQRVR